MDIVRDTLDVVRGPDIGMAKYVLQNVSADFGLPVRAAIIFVIITSINVVKQKFKEFAALTNLQT